jgi:polysaccharide pyruvyl transferase WcaK-like protein
MNVVLIGSYDGSGNLGDIAQLDAAVQLVQRLEAKPLPVIEAVHADSHRELRPALEEVLAYEPGGAFALSEVAAVYLYGGGYLNATWGARKLAMVRAALQSAPDAACVSSGLQADATWVAQLGPADRELLARFAPFGVRDPLSAQALAPLGATEETGDDAVAVLPEPSGVTKEQRVNVHVAEHSWVTDRPGDAASRWLEALAEFDQAPVVQPLVPYHDRVTSELAAAERFAATCRKAGYETAGPLVLRPETLASAAPVIESAQLTLSCSYHVALTSLLLGVPAELARDSRYYEQKAAGLAADFGNPGGALNVRMRRVRAEAALTARLAAAALAGAGERARRHAAQVVGLRAELAQLRLELRAHERQATDPWLPVDARLQVDQARATADAARAARAAEAARRRELEARVAELERQLDLVYDSRSWRLTAPLRATRPRRRGSTL